MHEEITPGTLMERIFYLKALIDGMGGNYEIKNAFKSVLEKAKEISDWEESLSK